MQDLLPNAQAVKRRAVLSGSDASTN